MPYIVIKHGNPIGVYITPKGAMRKSLTLSNEREFKGKNDYGVEMRFDFLGCALYHLKNKSYIYTDDGFYIHKINLFL